jgi:hypothetical protein
MSKPEFEYEIAKKVPNLNIEQQEDVMKYVVQIIPNPVVTDKYRKTAINEIRKALKMSADF